MRIFHKIIAGLCYATLIAGFATADPDIDPFAAAGESSESLIEKAAFTTTGFYKITPRIGLSSPDEAKPEAWPQIPPPTHFNRHFDKPPLLWRVAGGFFAAFDGGEWGGALFYRNDNDKKWLRVIDTHIQQMEEFGENVILATGGLSHLDMTEGTAYIITRRPTGRWVAEKVFHSRTGIPFVFGSSETGNACINEKLIVLTIEDSPGFFGVSRAGIVHYLGVRKPDQATPSGGNPSKPVDKAPVEK